MQKSIDKNHLKKYLAEGNQLRKEGKFAEAIEQYSKILHLNPNCISALIELAGIYESRKEYEQAIAHYQQIIEIKPQHSVSYARLGKLMMLQKNIPEAITAYQKAIELNPELLAALIGLGQIYESRKEYEQAIAYYQQIIEINPQHSVSYARLGRLMMLQKNIPEAIAAYQKAIELNPELPTRVYIGLANALEQNQEADEAISVYQKAIDKQTEALQTNPSCISALMGLAEIYESRKEYEQAIACYQQVVEINPQHSLSYARLGKLMMTQKNIQGVIAAYEKAITLKPEQPLWVYRDLANSLNQNGQIEKWNFFREEALKKSERWNTLKQIILNEFSDIDIEQYLILLLCPDNIGDTFHCLSLLKSISKYFQKKIILFHKTKVEKLCEMYDGEYLFARFKNDSTLYSDAAIFFQSIKPGKPATMGPGFIPGKSISDSFEFITDHRKMVLGMPRELMNEAPNIKEKYKVKAREKFKKFNLTKGKTVLISPYANTWNRIKNVNQRYKAFWLIVAKYLINRDFCVVLNLRNHEKLEGTIEGCMAIDIPISEVIPFVEEAGYFIGMRSGLSDLLMFAKASKKVIYPIKKHLKLPKFSDFEEYVIENPDNFDISSILSDWYYSKE